MLFSWWYGYELIFLFIYLIQQTEVELGEDTMPLKIGELKLVPKRIKTVICYAFKWSHVYLVCMFVHFLQVQVANFGK